MLVAKYVNVLAMSLSWLFNGAAAINTSLSLLFLPEWVGGDLLRQMQQRNSEALYLQRLSLCWHAFENRSSGWLQQLFVKLTNAFSIFALASSTTCPIMTKTLKHKWPDPQRKVCSNKLWCVLRQLCGCNLQHPCIVSTKEFCANDIQAQNHSHMQHLRSQKHKMHPSSFSVQ